MRTFVSLGRIAAVAGAAWMGGAAEASFHFMQIEMIIGGVNGDPTAQAIQLRTRAGFQNQVQFGKLVVRDAAGNNPIVLINTPTAVLNTATGARVLYATANFMNMTTPAANPDFILTNPIPPSYLAAGSLTWEDISSSTVLWRVSWGGAAYTGPGTGSVTNDADGNFNPPLAGPLPSSGGQAYFFTGAATAPSTNNLADYALTAGAAVFTNDAGTTYTVTGAPTGACCLNDGSCLGNQTFSACQQAGGVYHGNNSLCGSVVCEVPCPGDIAPQPKGDGVVNVSDLLMVINSWGACAGCPADFVPSGGDGVVNVTDLLGVINHWGACP